MALFLAIISRPQTAAVEAAAALWGGCTVGITVTAKIQGKGEEFNVRAIFLEDGRKREDLEEDQLWCDLQEEVLKLTGSIINTSCTYVSKQKQKKKKKAK